MESDSLDDSSLMSPSKARQVAAQAKDWAYIMNWLNRRYAPKPVPHFERNEDTLKTLFTLAAANDSADEETVLLHKAQEETIHVLKARQETRILDDVIGVIEDELDDKGSKSLEDMAETSVLLGTLAPDVKGLSHGLVDLEAQEFEATDQFRKIEDLQKYLEREHHGLQTQLDELNYHGKYETPADLPMQTTKWLRDTKLLNSKISEYQERITASERSGSIKGPSIEDLMTEEESVLSLRDNVKHLEGIVNTFHGLPPNVEDFRREYGRASKELQSLVLQRDKMFENLVNRQ